MTARRSQQHLESLRLLAEQWTSWNGFFAPDVMVAGLHALALGGPTVAGGSSSASSD